MRRKLRANLARSTGLGEPQQAEFFHIFAKRKYEKMRKCIYTCPACQNVQGKVHNVKIHLFHNSKPLSEIKVVADALYNTVIHVNITNLSYIIIICHMQ